MSTTTPTILDQIIAEKTKISERLARLDTDRAAVATRLTDLETAEHVLTRVSKTPPARKTTSAAAAAAKSRRQQVSNTQTQRTESGRAHPGAGYRQDPTGTLRGVPQ